MDAVRCLECGETRWSLLNMSKRLVGEPCQICGGQTVVERRRPGTSKRRPLVERRDRGPLGSSGPRERAGI